MVEKCPEWEKPLKAAQYYGSANHGLGFLHIDLEGVEGQAKLGSILDNYGVLTIEEGEMDKEGIILCLKRMFDKDWSWELKGMDEYRFMIRFPPNKKVEDIVMGDMIWFPLNKEGVMASLKAWDGEIKPIGRLVEAWVQVRGIPPKWSGWVVFQQIASSLGKLADIDWYSLFSSQHEMVRLKIKCKDPTKIPTQRLLEMNDDLFILSYKVENFEQIQKSKNQDEDDDGGDGDDDPDLDEDDLLGDELPENNTSRTQATTKTTEKGQGSTSAERKEASQSGKHTPGNSSKRTAYQSQEAVELAWQSINRKAEIADKTGEMNTQYCMNLLRAMELEEKEENSEMEQIMEAGEDNELINLPEEWVYSLSEGEIRDNTQPPSEVNNGEEMLPEQEEQHDQEGDVNMLGEQGKTTIGEEGRTKRKTNKWGPIQAEKRSTRLREDGKTALEKAQNLKRKVNLEDNQGKKTYASAVLSKSEFFHIAEVVGVTVEKNNKDISGDVLAEIQELDKDRTSSFSLACKNPTCSKDNKEVDLAPEDGMDVQDEAPVTPKQKAICNKLNSSIGIDEHSEWTDVAPRKKNKKRTK